MKPEFSIVIPTRNAVGIIDRLIDSLKNQEFPYSHETIFLVTESSDNTETYLRKIAGKNQKIIHIPKAEFNHGRTRMKGARIARGDFVIFLTEDVILQGKDFLLQLTRPIKENEIPAVYGVYQSDPMNADPVMAYMNNSWFLSAPDIVEPISQSEWNDLSPGERRKLCNFDNCASCIRRQIILKLQIPDVPYGEDMFFAKRLILNHHSIGLAKKAKFFHWHRMSFGYCLKRMCLDQHLTLKEFGLVYVKNKWDLFWKTGTGILHRLWICFFVLPIPFPKKIYWAGYHSKILFAEVLGKYIGKLTQVEESKSWNPINRRLFRLKQKIVAEISKKSIPRN